MEVLGLAIIAAGIVVVLFGLALIGGGSPYPLCSGCRGPMPDGYTAAVDGACYCRPCCRRLGIRPWYWKDELGDPWPPRVGG